MAPLTRRARAVCSLSGAELGIDTGTGNDMRNGTTRSTREEGNGPGSTGGRAHGSFGVQNFPDMGYGANLQSATTSGRRVERQVRQPRHPQPANDCWEW